MLLQDILLLSFFTYLTIKIASWFFRFLDNKKKAHHFDQIAKKKRAQRDQQIKDVVLPIVDISPSLREKLLNSDAIGLLEMLKAREVTSEQILISYFQRAITIGLDLALLAEINFAEALETARKYDQLRRENPSACHGLIFGLPMSIKDVFILKGTDTSAGVASKLFKPAQEDGFIVKILKEEGAIPYVTSNVPQAILCTNTNNHIYGQAMNPWDRERIPSGSSGGEAGLIACRASPFGIGNDLGGSLRTPPLYCGVVGFRPTSNRVTRIGTVAVSAIMDHTMNIQLATGPITKSVRDANLMMKVLLNSEAHNKATLAERDPVYLRKEWKDSDVQQAFKPLRIGYFKSMNLFPTTPANRRAVEEAAQALRSKGHELFEVDFPNFEEVALLFSESISCEGNAEVVFDALLGETPIEEHAVFRTVASLPNIVKRLLSAVMELAGEKRVAKTIRTAYKKDAAQYLKLISRFIDTRAAFYKTWQDKKLDALLSPGTATPALKIGGSRDSAFCCSYAYAMSVLDLPSGVLPVTVVKEGEDVYTREMAIHNDMMYKAIEKSMKGSVGLPIGVQISTLPWEDEKCIGLMLQLEEEVGFAKKHPYSALDEKIKKN